MRLIDSHTHLYFSHFDADREAVITRARASGLVAMINVGTDLATSQQAIKLAEANDDIWATVGLHPTDIGQEFAREEFSQLALHSKVVAIGECGLDYYRINDLGFTIDDLRKKQKSIFEGQIELALELNKPLMIHCRNAYGHLLEILKSYILNHKSPLRGNLHFFAGTWEEGKKFLDLGFTLSFAGPITFTNQYDEVIKNTPLNRLLVETDAPFAAPAPYRGRRNEPGYVVEVAKRIADLKGAPLEEIIEATILNASRLFNLPIA